MSAKPLFRPLGNRVYVRREVAAKTTAGGLHIPETALRPATDRGVVVAVGPGGIGAHGKHVAVSVSVGDEVLINRQAIELDVPMDDGNNEKLVIVQEHELLGYRAVKPAAKRGRPPKFDVEDIGLAEGGAFNATQMAALMAVAEAAAAQGKTLPHITVKRCPLGNAQCKQHRIGVAYGISDTPAGYTPGFCDSPLNMGAPPFDVVESDEVIRQTRQHGVEPAIVVPSRLSADGSVAQIGPAYVIGPRKESV